MPVQWRGRLSPVRFHTQRHGWSCSASGRCGHEEGPGGGDVGRAGLFICGTGADSGRGYAENTDVRGEGERMLEEGVWPPSTSQCRRRERNRDEMGGPWDGAKARWQKDNRRERKMTGAGREDTDNKNVLGKGVSKSQSMPSCPGRYV